MPSKNSKPNNRNQPRKAGAKPRKRNQRGPTRQATVVMAPRRGLSKAAPVSISTGTTVVTNALRKVVQSRREYVGELVTPPQPEDSKSPSYTGSVAIHDLNPGLRTVFPWLSQVASYEQFKFNRLSFNFQSSMPTSSPGQVVMVTNVDVKDPVMTSAVEVMSYSGACTGRVWDSHTHRVPPQATTKKNYVRFGPVPQGADASLYDVGKFYAFCVGVEWDKSLGTLWVDYEVEFFVPKILTGLSSNVGVLQGDKKTLTNAEPFGADNKLRATPGTTSLWSCQDGETKEGYCKITIDPQGNNYINITGISRRAEESYQGIKMEHLGQLLNVTHFEGAGNVYTRSLFGDEGEAAPASYTNYLAQILDPEKPLDLWFRDIGNLQESAVIPSVFWNLFKDKPVPL